tara:strand:- start:43212 stop:43523 length:312 start_codon:yes stop_codon:yes gene_type:complete
MELSIDTKIGVIDFSYDNNNDEVIAYINDGDDEWEGIKDFTQSFGEYVEDHELNLRITDHWSHHSESHYTTLSYDSMTEYLDYAHEDFEHYLGMNLKKMGLIK